MPLRLFSVLTFLLFLGVSSSLAADCNDLLRIKALRPELSAHRRRILSGEIPVPRGTLQRFSGVGNRLVYNSTGEFIQNGKTCLAARVEALHDESQTEVMFFARGPGGIFQPVPGAPVFRLQDPFMSDFGNEIVFGGVETFARPNGNGLGYRTVFYRGADIFHLKRFAVGPDNMKDIRIAKTTAGVVLATRPQDHFHPDHPERDAGPGTIGMTLIGSLDELTTKTINDATLYPQLLPQGSWGGINELLPLDERHVGVLGHVAEFSNGPKEGAERDRNYFPFVAIWDAQTLQFSRPEIILERADLPKGFSKRRDLRNVLFSGGIDLKLGTLWVGAADAQVYRVRLGYNPFTRRILPKF